jgi:glycosyltransferase involved in cell wall biosynthesis
MRASIVIRTLNEAKYLPALLRSIAQQRTQLEVETIVVDSGSSDGTLDIAQQFHCRLAHIRREDFSFGRSLNIGCDAASGEVLVFISGHCVPTDEHWLERLCGPVARGELAYSYGRQVGGPTSQFSECRIFGKYFAAESRLPQAGIFCNNANSALSRAAWLPLRFDEDLTGLEDMELAKRLSALGGRIGYVADACVFHHHQESWPQVQRRFQREAIALRRIMPQIHVGWYDTVRYIVSSIVHDTKAARQSGRLRAEFENIVRYRVAQYLGTYRGNHEHRRLSHAEKDSYFYPASTSETL